MHHFRYLLPILILSCLSYLAACNNAPANQTDDVSGLPTLVPEAAVIESDKSGAPAEFEASANVINESAAQDSIAAESAVVAEAAAAGDDQVEVNAAVEALDDTLCGKIADVMAELADLEAQGQDVAELREALTGLAAEVENCPD